MRALVLSGGGCKGAYQVGALKKWLLEDGRDYEILCGVSVGALNVAALSQARIGDIASAYSKLYGLWDSIDTPKVCKNRLFGMASMLWSESIMVSKPLRDLVDSTLDAGAIASSGRTVRVGATSWNTGEYRVASESDPDFKEWVKASASFPVFLEPVAIDGHLWTDGGVRNVTPLATAIRLGADEVDVIMCSNPDLPSPWNPDGQNAMPGYLERVVDLMSDQIVRTDLQVCGLKNDIAEIDGRYRKVSLRVLQPSVRLTDDSLSFDPATIHMMMRRGYEDACSM